MPVPSSPIDVDNPAFDPDVHCGARTRQGTQCMQAAGWKTEHPGEGRCKLHGGNAGRPIVHGFRSKYAQRRIADRVEEVQNSPELLSLNREIATLKVLQDDFLQRFSDEYDQYLVDLEVWDALVEANGGELPDGIKRPMPPALPVDQLDTLNRLIRTQHDMKFAKRNSIPIAELQIVLQQIQTIVKEWAFAYGLGPDALADFADRLQSRVRISAPPTLIDAESSEVA